VCKLYASFVLLACSDGTIRKQQFENQLLMNTWKIKWEDIEPLRSGKAAKDGSTVCAIVTTIRNSNNNKDNNNNNKRA